LTAVLFLLFASTAAFAQIGFATPDAQPKASITGSIQKRTGDEVEGTIVAKIADGWHVNSNTPSEEFAIPTVLEVDETAELLEAKYPQHQMKAFEFTGGKPLAVYDGTINIAFRAKLKGGATKINVALRFQACSDRVCLPPNTARTEIDATKIV